MAELPTRRQTIIGLGATGVLVAEGGHDARADPKALEASARTEGTLTWYTGQMDTEKAERLGKAFTARYPGVRVAVIRTTGQVAYQRLLLDIKNKTPQCDVFSTTDISHMPALKERKELAAYTPENGDGMVPAFKALSDPGWWYVTNASRYFLMYNTDKIKPEDAPRKWTDLLLPKYKGRVAVGHPGFSGCTGAWALSLQKLYGWEFFEKLAKNNPRVGRSAIDPVTLMNAGEAVIGPSSANTAYQALDRGNPVQVVHPDDGVVVCVTPSGIPIAAPHPNAARLFLNWMLSEEYSSLMSADGTEPVRDGVTQRAGVPRLSSLKIIPLSPDEIRTGVPPLVERWRDTFGS